MPSLRLELPEHVTRKPPRADGTCRVLFEVRRNRPPDWPSTIPLPRTGRRTGNLADADEVARIVADALALTAELEAMRAATGAQHPPGSLPAVAASWRKSDWWAELRPRTQNFYDGCLGILEDWAVSKGKPQLAALDLRAIIKFLNRYNDRPAQKSNLKRTLSALFSFAREEGIVPVHPFGTPVRMRRRRTGRKTPVQLWRAGDVTDYRAAGDGAGDWPAGAMMVWIMWETSADAADVVTWRRDVHFRDGPVPGIDFTRGKTGERGFVPISPALAQAIRTCGRIYLVVNPQGRPYAPDDVADDRRRTRHFNTRLRDVAVAAGGRRLILDHLRHSAATDAIEKGATPKAAARLTLHRDSSTLERFYWEMTEAQAIDTQRLRGIIP